ncbi:MAG: hypothetical protein ACNA8W_00665 [Bradymonadaceae bacterium]
MRFFVAALFVPFLASSGLCGKSEPPAEAEVEKPAAERLQKGRNVYDGNVNENLRELRQDLEEAGSDRAIKQDGEIDRAVNPQ